MPEPSVAPQPSQPPASAGRLAPVVADPTLPAIAVRGLVKSFGEVRAVDGLDLDIPRGSFYGLVGPNGAGKTTALSMITGILQPTAGRAWVMGTDVWEDPRTTKAASGVLADGLGTFDRLSGRELLLYNGLLRGMDAETLTPRVDELLGALDLQEAAGRLVTDYSAGMTKKILLASALVHAPRLLVLDEPLEAVDPVSGQIIRQILADYVAGGGTVVMSSHVMELVEGLCDHVGIIAEGRVLASGALDEVRRGDALVDVFIDLVGARNVVEGSLSWLRS